MRHISHHKLLSRQSVKVDVSRKTTTYTISELYYNHQTGRPLHITNMHPTYLRLPFLAMATHVVAYSKPMGMPRGWHPDLYRVSIVSETNNTENVYHRIKELENYMTVTDDYFPHISLYDMKQWREVINMNLQSIIQYYKRDESLPSGFDYLVAFQDGGEFTLERRDFCPIAFEVYNWVEYLVCSRREYLARF